MTELPQWTEADRGVVADALRRVRRASALVDVEALIGEQAGEVLDALAAAGWVRVDPQLHDLTVPQLAAELAEAYGRLSVAYARLDQVTSPADPQELQRLRAEVDRAWTAAGDMAAIEEGAAKDRGEVARLRAELERVQATSAGSEPAAGGSSEQAPAGGEQG